MDESLLGKKAESKIREWLSIPEDTNDFNRIPDQMTGFYGSKNICDFYLYKYPHMYYFESKASYKDTIPFSMITDYQREELLKKSKIFGVRSLVFFLFASYQRAFAYDIRDIQSLIDDPGGQKSLNIKKIDKWPIPYAEIPTIPSRKELLDYTGSIEDLIFHLDEGRPT